nr:unnamed protein product [Callosobruchus analis]
MGSQPQSDQSGNSTGHQDPRPQDTQGQPEQIQEPASLEATSMDTQQVPEEEWTKVQSRKKRRAPTSSSSSEDDEPAQKPAKKAANKRRDPTPEPGSSRDQTAETPASSKRPPPIFIHKEDQWKAVRDQLPAATTKLTSTGIRLQVKTVEDYRQARRLLEERKVELHSYTLEEDKLLHVVIRGIPNVLTLPEDIAAEYSIIVALHLDIVAMCILTTVNILQYDENLWNIILLTKVNFITFTQVLVCDVICVLVLHIRNEVFKVNESLLTREELKCCIPMMTELLQPRRDLLLQFQYVTAWYVPRCLLLNMLEFVFAIFIS